ncbi:replicase [Vagococcus fessus]|uniref:Replicase n=1 Tax=Vagococcus fessus TaxID=120370 RepID=A0A430A563_9ENTE|nr:replicase [Vagococcus fessus]RSU01937.1 replicase [Vagococcus fessus]
MKLIIRGRASGKTTELIKISSDTGRYILARSNSHARSIYEIAKRNNINIPYPVTAEEVVNHHLDGSSIKRDGLIVDEALSVLEGILGIQINAATISITD